jgi:hypothetical protein
LLFLLFLQEIYSERQLLSGRNPGISAMEMTEKQRETTLRFAVIGMNKVLSPVPHLSYFDYRKTPISFQSVVNDTTPTINSKAKM